MAFATSYMTVPNHTMGMRGAITYQTLKPYLPCFCIGLQGSQLWEGGWKEAEAQYRKRHPRGHCVGSQPEPQERGGMADPRHNCQTSRHLVQLETGYGHHLQCHSREQPQERLDWSTWLWTPTTPLRWPSLRSTGGTALPINKRMCCSFHFQLRCWGVGGYSSKGNRPHREGIGKTDRAGGEAGSQRPVPECKCHTVDWVSLTLPRTVMV